MRLLNLLNGEDSWHDKEQLEEVRLLTKQFFTSHQNELNKVVNYAQAIRNLTDVIDSFIQQNTSVVCPHCQGVCCLNRHGYYDYEDLIYISAIGAAPPAYTEGIDDTAPCQFLSTSGCLLTRAIRPFRCNWHFCDALLTHMENGPARSYRNFINRFHEIIHLRKQMIDGCHEITLRLI